MNLKRLMATAAPPSPRSGPAEGRKRPAWASRAPPPSRRPALPLGEAQDGGLPDAPAEGAAALQAGDAPTRVLVHPPAPEWCLDFWHPSEKAMYPDYFSKREQWKRLQLESWEKEVKQLEEETPPGGPENEALPPARKEGHLPPLWWHYVTRPREQPM
uniref:NADH dehydrogenase [ubiquinone] 1 beta subcomplex subunit 9 n=1 Tax=Gopherus evgoodei TaxID=1825980 RepID=A0A8C4YCI6_9SAUR